MKQQRIIFKLVICLAFCFFFSKLGITAMAQETTCQSSIESFVSSINESYLYDFIVNTMEIYFNKLKSIVWFRKKEESRNVIFIREFPIGQCTVDEIYDYLLLKEYTFDQFGYLECLKN